MNIIQFPDLLRWTRHKPRTIEHTNYLIYQVNQKYLNDEIDVDVYTAHIELLEEEKRNKFKTSLRTVRKLEEYTDHEQL